MFDDNVLENDNSSISLLDLMINLVKTQLPVKKFLIKYGFYHADISLIRQESILFPLVT